MLVIPAVTAFSLACHASLLIPQIHNPGFENGVDGWGWMTYNGAQASYRADDSNPHSGAQCLVVWNKSKASPHVYGRLGTQVQVLPDTEYQLSVWARGRGVSDGPGACHFTDWHIYTLNLPIGDFDWQKVSTRFKTRADQESLTLGLNVANTCEEMAIDDVFLEAVGVPLSADFFNGKFIATPHVIGDNISGQLGIHVASCLSGGFFPFSKGPVVQATIARGDVILLDKRKRIRRGDNRLEWEWNSVEVPPGSLRCTVEILGRKGERITSASQEIRKIHSPIADDIDDVEERLAEFNLLYDECRLNGIPLDYPSVTKTMLDQFIPLAREDVQKAHDWRAKGAVTDFHASIDKSVATMKAYLSDSTLAPNAVRYKTSLLTVDGLNLIGKRRDARGKQTQGPLFFCGYGHFGQVRRDMPRWPGYGINIIQLEVGPSVTLVSEDKTSLRAAKAIAKVLDNAAKHDVKVDVLLSPHYFPQWAFEKWPHLGKGGGHFLGYCVDAPEAKQVIERFLRAVVPLLRGKKALHSYCLSNEPVFNNTANCDNTKPLWAGYVASVHNTVEKMNARYGSHYPTFDAVPIPGNESYDEPQFYDYCSFNNERFAAWHEWMAGIIREMAPDVPLHAKMMSMALPHRFTVSWGCDPELFGRFSDLNGNDCLIRGRAGGGWALPFHLQNMSYDLQRSLNGKPVFNSENHPTNDRSTEYVHPNHFRTALWQGAIHGQSSTTIWAWERTGDRGHDFYGNVMDRPGCAESVGMTCLDLNRFADEVTALQNVKAPVAILFSIACITRNPKYQETLYHAYCALNFCGVKIDFISERQLAAKRGSQYGMIVLPDATHVLPSTFDAIRTLPDSTRRVIVGEGPVKDPYGMDYPTDKLKEIREKSFCCADADPEKVLWPALLDEMKALDILPEQSVVDASSEQPVWGVEWLPAAVKGAMVINIVDLRDEPKRIKILSNGETVEARDLLSLGGREKVGTLEPMLPVLARLKP